MWTDLIDDDSRPSQPLRSLYIGAAVAVVLALVAAFWMLCSQQVREAEGRRAQLQLQRMAIADCMHYGATVSLTACRQRVAPQSDMMRTAAVADFTYR